MQSIYVFLDIAIFVDFYRKIKTQVLCHVIYIIFGSFLGKV